MYVKLCFIVEEKVWYKKGVWVLELYRFEFEKFFCYIGIVRLIRFYLSFYFFNIVVIEEIESEICLWND